MTTVTGNLWPIGVIITIGASVGSNGGINLQKVSIMREVLKPAKEQRPFPLQPLWLLGFIAVVSGAIGDFLGLAFAPQSLLIPLGGSSLIANIWFARWCLGEQAKRREYISTILLLIGVVIISATGSKVSLTYDLGELAYLFAQPPFVAYIIIIAIVIAALYWYQLYCSQVRSKFGPWSKEYKRVFRSHVISLPFLAGLIAAQTIWSAKSTIGLITLSTTGSNQVVFFGFWALAATTVTLVLLQLRFLTAALATGPSLTVVPIFHSSLIVFSIIGGGVLFEEFAKMSGVEIGLFVVGLLILLTGLWILSNRKLVEPHPPSKLALYSLIFRFIFRMKHTLRTKENDNWPNRLHLYSCTCGCHIPVLRGDKPALRLLADGGAPFGTGGYRIVEEIMGARHGYTTTNTLATIDDHDENIPESDDDGEHGNTDYALAKAELAAHLNRPAPPSIPSSPVITRNGDKEKNVDTGFLPSGIINFDTEVDKVNDEFASNTNTNNNTNQRAAAYTIPNPKLKNKGLGKENQLPTSRVNASPTPIFADPSGILSTPKTRVLARGWGLPGGSSSTIKLTQAYTATRTASSDNILNMSPSVTNKYITDDDLTHPNDKNFPTRSSPPGGGPSIHAEHTVSRNTSDDTESTSSSTEPKKTLTAGEEATRAGLPPPCITCLCRVTPESIIHARHDYFTRRANIPAVTAALSTASGLFADGGFDGTMLGYPTSISMNDDIQPKLNGPPGIFLNTQTRNKRSSNGSTASIPDDWDTVAASASTTVGSNVSPLPADTLGEEGNNHSHGRNSTLLQQQHRTKYNDNVAVPPPRAPSLTLEEVAGVAKRVSRSSSLSLSGGVYYDATNPAVPSYLPGPSLFTNDRMMSGGGGGGGGGGSASSVGRASPTRDLSPSPPPGGGGGNNGIRMNTLNNNRRSSSPAVHNGHNDAFGFEVDPAHTSIPTTQNPNGVRLTIAPTEDRRRFDDTDDDDDTDPVVGAIEYLGESIVKLAGRTQNNISKGLRTVRNTLVPKRKEDDHPSTTTATAPTTTTESISATSTTTGKALDIHGVQANTLVGLPPRPQIRRPINTDGTVETNGTNSFEAESAGIEADIEHGASSAAGGESSSDGDASIGKGPRDSSQQSHFNGTLASRRFRRQNRRSGNYMNSSSSVPASVVVAAGLEGLTHVAYSAVKNSVRQMLARDATVNNTTTSAPTGTTNNNTLPNSNSVIHVNTTNAPSPPPLAHGIPSPPTPPTTSTFSSVTVSTSNVNSSTNSPI